MCFRATAELKQAMLPSDSLLINYLNYRIINRSSWLKLDFRPFLLSPRTLLVLLRLLRLLNRKVGVYLKFVLSEPLREQPAVENIQQLHCGMFFEGEDLPPRVVEGDFLEQGLDEGVEVLDVGLGSGRPVSLQHFEVEGQQQAHQHLQIFELAL